VAEAYGVNIFAVAPLITAGIVLFIGLYHLLIYARWPRNRENLTFALLSFSVFSYSLASSLRYTTFSDETAAVWQRGQFFSASLIFLSLTWFVVDYLQISGRTIPRIITAYYLVEILLLVINPPDWIFKTGQFAQRAISITDDLTISYLGQGIGPLATVFNLVSIIVFGYLLTCAVRAFKSRDAGRALPLLVALSLYLLGGLNDLAVSLAIYDFVFLFEFGFLAFVLMMAYSLSSSVVKAAETQQALTESEANYEALVENATDGIFILHGSAIAFSNPAMVEILGYEQTEIIGRDLLDFVPPEKKRTYDRRWQSQLDQEADQALQAGTFEATMLHKSGSQRAVEITTGDIQFEGRHSLVGFVRDVTERKSIAARLQHDSVHDQLTELPNRALFIDRLNHAIQRKSQNPDFHFAALFLNLDRFKVVNDSLGHLAGDEMLRECGQRINAAVRTVDTVARFGGDEFGILIDDYGTLHEVNRIANAIQAQFERPFSLNEQEILNTVTIGVVLGEAHYVSTEEIIRDGDIAIYRAKAQGQGEIEVFDRVMRDQIMSQVQVEKHLRRALENEEFRLHYQPIVSIDTGKIAGFEALLRWEQPDLGLVHPASFISLAEESGLIVPIGDWVLKEAVDQAKQWQQSFRRNPQFFINVNLSARQLTRPDVVQKIAQVTDELDFAPEFLNLEVTESVLIAEDVTASEVLNKLKDRGHNLHMDDFGSGYSSLSYLHRYPFDAIKIDRTFIANLDTDETGRPLVNAIVTMGRELGMSVIAEGIENAGQLASMRETGCDFGQGYYLGSPLPADRISAILELIFPTRTPQPQ
jgi:diguanylate cyclase (GGDEF)-like protein/PAS domain S-box-containing protein